TDIANITRKRLKPDKNEHENGKSTDIANITRKRLKPDKNEHENGKSTQEP
nr:hypothetical protein [Tanacetum cinerariifolium]